jgi:hypothetical protein
MGDVELAYKLELQDFQKRWRERRRHLLSGCILHPSRAGTSFTTHETTFTADVKHTKEMKSAHNVIHNGDKKSRRFEGE